MSWCAQQSWLSAAVAAIDGMYKGCGLSTCVGIYSSASQWSPIMWYAARLPRFSIRLIRLID